MERLAIDADRVVVPHVDDLGTSHGANQAFLALAAAGHVTCGSVMVPGAWFPHIAAAARADPTLDLGVHLTLTSEWRTCRWAPLSTGSKASGLIDDDGYLWHDVESLRRHLVPEAAEIELRTQIDHAIAAGIRPTHIDAHMGAAMLPGVLDAHVRLAEEYGVFPVLPRSIEWPPDLGAYRKVVRALDARGAPVVDHCRGTLAVDPGILVDGWRQAVAALPDGVTHLALHATVPGDFTAMAPDHAPWRYAEYQFLAAGGLRDMLSKAQVGTVGTRALQRLWLAA